MTKIPPQPQHKILDRLDAAVKALETIAHDARATYGPQADAAPTLGAMRGSDLAYFLSDLRRIREIVFGAQVIDDESWTMILHLVIAEAEGISVSILSLRAATGIPQTTTIRKLAGLAKAGLATREQDPLDRRRVTVALTDRAQQLFATISAQVTTNERRRSGKHRAP